MTICYSYTRAREEEEEEEGEKNTRKEEKRWKRLLEVGSVRYKELGNRVIQKFRHFVRRKSSIRILPLAQPWNSLAFYNVRPCFSITLSLSTISTNSYNVRAGNLEPTNRQLFFQTTLFLLVTSRSIISFWTCSMFSWCTRRDYELTFRRLPGSFTPPAIFYSWFSSKRNLIPFFKRLFDIRLEK